MTTQPKPEDDPKCPEECGCGTNAGCGGASCPMDFGTGAAEVSGSFLATPREGNFRLTWYNRWNNGGAPANFYGGAGANWSVDTFAYMTTNADNELVFIWSPGGVASRSGSSRAGRRTRPSTALGRRSRWTTTRGG